ncbi:unnamed protein product, partial [Gongylonema pulchrum]|uniref:Heat shock protein YegD n=1 Tax=Gongylonema pulchrum TaxID=637853 RepID=A0A183DHX6_9BILA
MSNSGLDRRIIHLDLGSCRVTTMKHVLEREPESRLCLSLKADTNIKAQTEQGTRMALFPYFNDTLYLSGDAFLIQILLDALRHPQMLCLLPDNFNDWNSLLREVCFCLLKMQKQFQHFAAQHLGLKRITKWIQENRPNPHTIIVAYHGTLTFGRQGFAADVNF